MKPAGRSCNIPIGQNPPTWRGNNIVLARLGPMTLCSADPHVLVVASLLVVPLHSTSASYPGATSPSRRVSHRGSNGDGKPSTTKTCPLPNLINIFLNEYSGFSFELNFELDHF